MKIEVKLANTFKAIVEQADRTDTVASQMLAICKAAKAFTIEKFDNLVAAAYEEAGWNPRGGRPTNGDRRPNVPNTVRTYVSIVRRAIRARMKIGKYATFSALRAALLKKKVDREPRTSASPASLPSEVRNDFVGVSLATPEEPNGALFHDLAWTFLNLPKDQRSLFGRQLSRLLHMWQARVEAKAAPTRKAA